MTQTKVILNKIRTFILGQRAKGEYAYKKTTFRTVGGDKPPEFEWYREFRVSCLHGKQNAHL